MNSTIPVEPFLYTGEGSPVDHYLSKNKSILVPTTGGLPWGSFTKSKPTPAKRKVLFSRLYNAKWTHVVNGKDVPDLARLGDFLASAKSPVNKPLKKLDDLEIEKIITAMSNVVKHVWNG